MDLMAWEQSAPQLPQMQPKRRPQVPHHRLRQLRWKSRRPPSSPVRRLINHRTTAASYLRPQSQSLRSCIYSSLQSIIIKLSHNKPNTSDRRSQAESPAFIISSPETVYLFRSMYLTCFRDNLIRHRELVRNLGRCSLEAHTESWMCSSVVGEVELYILL